MRNIKKLILTLIILLVVGFASISTVLDINGNLSIVFDENEFRIIFESVKLNGLTKKRYINENKDEISFTSLDIVEANSVLDYKLANISRQYNAQVSVKCESTNADNIEFVVEPSTILVEAGKKANGKVNIIYDTSSTTIDSIVCSFDVDKLSRTTLGDEYIEPFSKSGVLKSTAKGDTSEFWGYKSSITKVVFEDEMMPHDTDEDLIFDVSEGTKGSVMAYLVANEDDNTKYTLYIQSDTGVKANEYSSYLFSDFTKLTTIEGVEYFDTSNVTTMNRMFRGCPELTNLNISSFDTSNVYDMYGMFYNCQKLTSLDLSNFNTSNVITMNQMFNGCSGLTSLDLSSFNTLKVKDMRSMFFNCTSLTSIDLSSFDTSNVEDMYGMFYDCTSLISFDLSNFNTGNVITMNRMFRGCSELTKLNISSFDTSNVENMYGMFYNCKKLTSLDLSNFNTSNVITMNQMFCGCSGLTSLDLSSFNTLKVEDMGAMFSGCSSLKELDLSNFDTSKVTNMLVMFWNMPASATVKVKDANVRDWILTNNNDHPSTWNISNFITVIEEA